MYQFERKNFNSCLVECVAPLDIYMYKFEKFRSSYSLSIKLFFPNLVKMKYLYNVVLFMFSKTI